MSIYLIKSVGHKCGMQAVGRPVGHYFGDHRNSVALTFTTTADLVREIDGMSPKI